MINANCYNESNVDDPLADFDITDDERNIK